MSDDFQRKLTQGRRRLIYVAAGAFVLFWLVILVFGRNKTPCEELVVCESAGRCTGRGLSSCYVGSDADCRRSSGCPGEGRCKKVDDKCLAQIDEDCLPSEVCRKYGRCTQKGGECVVSSDQDCKRSEPCKTSGACRAKPEAPHYGECVVPPS